MSNQRSEQSETATDLIDWPILCASILIVGILSGLIFGFPNASAKVVNQIFTLVTQTFGQIFIIAGGVSIAALLILALGPWRKIKLGTPEDKPHYSTFIWAGMLFSTGIGTAVLYWGAIEWIEYYLSPPFGIEARSAEAHQWAMSYGMFHWGLIGWAFYALPAVCLSYAYHVRRSPNPSLAEACSPLLKQATHRWPGRVINAIFMIGLIGSASTGLGLTTPLITESLETYFNIESTFGLTVGAIVLIVFLIGLSVSLGLDQGIKNLSTINIVLMLGLIGLILSLGPSKAICLQGIESIRFMGEHFLDMAGIRYPIENRAFTESWTVFYWAWWISFAPFVGMFICKISRGRTIGQLIWGILLFGTLGCTLCFIVFGGYASFLEFEQQIPIIETYSKNRHAAVIKIITSLSLGNHILPLFFLLCVSFAATTYDSASYTLALAATRTIGADEEPARWHRVLWASTLGILPLALLSIGRQSEVITALQTASLIVSIPMLLVSGMMLISLAINLRHHAKG